MTRVKCPFCEFDVAYTPETAAEVVATQKVLEHVRQDHPGCSIYTPKPGEVVADGLEDQLLTRSEVFGDASPGKFVSLSLTVSTKPGEEFRPYKMLGTVGGDLLMAGYDFSISRNQVNMDDPLPPYEVGGEYVHHDENTLTKVKVAIAEGLHDTPPKTTTKVIVENIVTALQNAGILFRERS